MIQGEDQYYPHLGTTLVQPWIQALRRGKYGEGATCFNLGTTCIRVHFSINMVRVSTYVRSLQHPSRNARNWVGPAAAAIGSVAARHLGNAAGRYFANRAVGALTNTRRNVFQVRTSFANRKRQRSRNVVYGMRGSKIRRIKKRRAAPKLYKMGVVIRDKAKGVQSNLGGTTMPVTFGHSTVYYDGLMRGLLCAMLRHLLEKAGYVIPALTSPIPVMGYAGADAARVKLAYRIQHNTVHSTVSYQVAGVDSILTVADALKAALEAAITGTTDNFYTLQFHTLELISSDATTLQNIPRGIIYLNQATVYYKLSSKLSFQNRTIADSTVGDDMADNENDVSNNPLVGKYYEKAGNGFRLFYDAYSGSVTSLHPTATDVSRYGTNWLGFSGAVQTAFASPPPSTSLLGCKKCRPVKLMPGQIRDSTLSSKGSISLNGLLAKMTNLFRGHGLTNDVPINMGYTRMFMLEKQCDTGVDEPQIEIGWEVDAEVQVGIKTKKPYMVPYNSS